MTDDGADELTDADFQTLAAFRFALRRFATFSSSAAQEVGLTTHQHQALLAIKAHPGRAPMTVGALAEQMLIAPHTSAELVGRLEVAGLVAKCEDPTDRRRVTLRLTEQAEAALRQLTLMHRREIREMAPRIKALLDELDTSRGGRFG